MSLSRSHIFCFTTRGIFWLLLLGCLNLFLTAKLTGLPKINEPAELYAELPVTSVKSSQPVERKAPKKSLFSHVNLSRGRLDQTRNFRIFDHVITGDSYDSLSAEYDVTLVSQSTLHKLHWLTQVTRSFLAGKFKRSCERKIQTEFRRKFKLKFAWKI